jgi:uncharacterized membrane-anchored protein
VTWRIDNFPQPAKRYRKMKSGDIVMQKPIVLAAAAMLLVNGALAAPASGFFSDYSSYNDEGRKVLDGLDIKSGSISLEDGVTLALPKDFYFLNKEDAAEVLVGAWGNPPDSSINTLGMIFPSKYSPISDGSWGIEVSFEKMGYVKDDDAASTNYDELLASMKSDTLDGNAEREKNGYEPITLIGWASPPIYDQTNKRLHWAKELQFGPSASHTLNYDVRFLGREGVFIMSYIANMEQLPEIKANLDPVLGLVSFKEGKKYADFTPGMDTVAAVGIGGLIAGKLAAKAGLIAVALLALKKFAILIIVPFLWLGRKIKAMFSKGNPDSV